MIQPTLGILEALRPPAGFRTAAALGATYSADLLTCMAVLTTLDGCDGEQLSYGRIEAFRALDRLRDKVRICYQNGRLSRRDGARYPSLAMLDRVLVPVRVSGSGSFHPKVWISRQVDGEGRERFVLVVSSRNVTTSDDWDLGVALHGNLGGTGIALPRVRDFVQHALKLAGDEARLATFGSLEKVRWELPPGVRGLSFDFQEGGASSFRVHPVWSTFPPKPARALLLSPFIDVAMIAEARRRWGDVPTRRLVAGVDNLRSVALSSRRADLRALEPRQMVPASEATEPRAAVTVDDSDAEVERARALHAKVIAVDDGRTATIVIGSNNLTGPGWCGGSTEAFVRVTGEPQLCEPLWDWAGRAHLFPFPEENASPPARPLLEQLKDELHRARFALWDHADGSPSRLGLLEPAVLALPPGVQLTVSRFSAPGDPVNFPVGSSEVHLPPCVPAARTRFIVCSLRHADEETGWTATAELEPPLGDDRDRELVARLLGVREFLAYLSSLATDDPAVGATEGDPALELERSGRSASGASGEVGVTLEDMLKELAEDPARFEEMERAVSRYGATMKARLPPEDRAVLEHFLSAWSAIREAFRR